MAYINRTILTGRLTADPEIRYTKNEVPVAHFRIASDRPKGKDGQANTDFINITAWNGLAKICQQYLKKGRLVAIDGRLQVNPYEKNGEKRSFVEVRADYLQMLDSKFAEASNRLEKAAV